MPRWLRHVGVTGLLFAAAALVILPFFVVTGGAMGSGKATDALFGAYCGALFVFLAVRIGDALGRFYHRQAEHYNALVKLQHYLSHAISITTDNIYLADNFIHLMSVPDDGENAVYVTQDRLFPIPVDSDLALDLRNLTLINNFLELDIAIKRMNAHAETLERGYNHFVARASSESPDPGELSENAAQLKEQMTAFRDALYRMVYGKAIDMAAEVFIASKKAPFSIKMVNLFIEERFNEADIEEIDKEKKRLRTEFGEIPK